MKPVVEASTVGWENSLSKIALNIFSNSRAKVVDMSQQPMGKTAPGATANNGSEEEEEDHFDHQKVAQDIFRSVYCVVGPTVNFSKYSIVHGI
jgi:hypothetical protein